MWRRCQTYSATASSGVHWSARVESKSDVLRMLSARATQYLSIELDDQLVRLHGGVAVVTGLASMHAEIAGTQRVFRNRYTATWAREGENWRMVSWQSTALRAKQVQGE
ncbi:MULTISPECIES: nuclear transport factor 2 family protein [unclassified Paraburkholderia]|uniref:nuclear transport factor 2 family protein n=1 Tax=unclassified Paraburkholderia TaxID=2615204 RepID=UPI0038B92F75